MFRIKNSLQLYVGILVLLTNSTFAVFTQTDQLSLQDVPNGFRGTFKSANQILTINSSEAADKSLLTKITNSEGRLVVETIYRNNLVTVTVSGVTIRFRTDKESIAAGYFDQLSRPDQEEFEAFRVSDESRILRLMILDIIKQRASGKPASLKGILIISLVLGDGPGFPSEVGFKKNKDAKCNPPKGLMVFASYLSPKASKTSPKATKLTNSKVGANTMVCDASTCCGCCGWGCSGCTGCYTGACYAHDSCVDQNGHAFCLALLPAAIASVVNECRFGMIME